VVLCSDSPRSVPPDLAQAIFASVGPFVTTVAVTTSVEPEDLARILRLRPAAIQVPPDLEVPAGAGVRVLKMLAPGDPLRDDCDAVVVDGSRGGGKPFDTRFARRCVGESAVPVILAGGLTPENVHQAVAAVRPYGVDVSSGVESVPGRKDHLRMRAFINACKEVKE
jgi:phosphoribosylanthranilate isomerase